MGIFQNKFRAEADNIRSIIESNVIIGNVLKTEDINAHAQNLRVILASIKIGDAYPAFVLNATLNGAGKYLNHIYKNNLLHQPFDEREAQILHRSIMDETRFLLPDHLSEIPDFRIEYFDNPAANADWGRAHFETQEVGVNIAKCESKIEPFFEIVAHETAHAIERKLAEQARRYSNAIPREFRAAAAYFTSLHENNAYINPELNHDLYWAQLNEKIARSTEKMVGKAFAAFET